MADAKAEETFEEVFEDGPPKEAQTIHRIRANSTIMQLKKILGEPWPAPALERAPRASIPANWSRDAANWVPFGL